MKKLDVLFKGWGQYWVLGRLADDGTHLLFEYTAEALQRNIEFSPRHLQLQPQAFANFPDYQQRLPGLIADALPDGWGLLLMDRLIAQTRLGLGRLSPLDRLAMIGDRAMGALAFEPALDSEPLTLDMNLLQLAKESHQEMHSHDSVALKALMRLGGSPHGARPKALVQFDEHTERISTDESALGEPWLIKFQALNEHKEVCAIEDAYATLARACHLQMPKTQYFDLDGQYAAFGVQRFDRTQGMRVPVHSLAGFLHADFRIPSLDYDTLLRATRLLTQNVQQLELAFERCVFNVIFHNRDDHAKNVAFRMNQQMQWELAPCYDLTFSEGPGGEHQMSIVGEGRAPTKTHLLDLASRNGIGAGQAKHVIERMAACAGRFLEIAGNHAIRKTTTQTIARAIELNRTRMLN